MKKVISATVASLLLAGCVIQQPPQTTVIQKPNEAPAPEKYNAIKFPRCEIMIRSKHTGGKFVSIGTDAQVTSMNNVYYGSFTSMEGTEFNVMSSIIERAPGMDQKNKIVDAYYGDDKEKRMTYTRSFNPKNNSFSFMAISYDKRNYDAAIGYSCPKAGAIPFVIK